MSSETVGRKLLTGIMISIFKAPKIQMAVALIAIFFTSLLHVGKINLLFLLFFSTAATIGSDFFFLKLRGKPLFFPSAAIVSAIIIVLVVPPNSPWNQVFLFGFLAMLSKNFLRVTEHHIFNPAAFGLLVGGIILRQSISWWGVSWQQLTSSPLAFIILLTPLLMSSLRMRRYFIQLSFLGFFAIFPVFGQAKGLLLDPTLLFFAAVMLPEPMTTPVRPISQLAFGITVALLSMINFFPDPLLIALLVGNLLFFKLR